jgi:3-deoxy-D-manno-octulosonic-acid transferase
MYLLYSLLATAAMVVLLPYFFLKGVRSGKYFHNLRERFGRLPQRVVNAARGSEGTIWVHAVSVGEALAGLPLARALKEKYPQRKLFISTTTDTGQRLARERFPFADGVFYFPLDWAFAVRRVLGVLRPSLVVILETEIWPNFLRETKRAGVPVMFVNGRLSQKSFRRYRRINASLPGFMRDVLSHPAGFLMQSAEDALRLGELGAAPQKVEVIGNLKYDLAPPARSAFVDWLEQEVLRGNRRPLIVAGSVVADEEPYVLIAFGTLAGQGQCKDALLVLAPRKPERFDAAAAHIEESQRKYIRRSRLALNGPLDPTITVILLDTVGELAAAYRLADGVFVGGSLVPAGGHNILEPALFGRAPVFGPSMENFKEMSAKFLAEGAAIEVRSPEDLGVAWIDLFQNRERRERMGAAARAIVERNRGTTQKALDRISAVLESRDRSAHMGTTPHVSPLASRAGGT